jgi:hypothetical protein
MRAFLTVSAKQDETADADVMAEDRVPQKAKTSFFRILFSTSASFYREY